MNAIFIELSDGSVYVAKTPPTETWEKPMDLKDEVILDLYNQLKQ